MLHRVEPWAVVGNNGSSGVHLGEDKKADSFGLLLSLSSSGLITVPVNLAALPYRFLFFFMLFKTCRIVISPIHHSFYCIQDLQSSRSNRFRNSECRTSMGISSNTLVNVFFPSTAIVVNCFAPCPHYNSVYID